MITTPNSTQPPAMTGCDYTVEVSPRAWKCMTTEEYIAREQAIQTNYEKGGLLVFGILSLVVFLVAFFIIYESR